MRAICWRSSPRTRAADFDLVGDEDEQIAILGAGELAEFGLLFVGDELGEGSGHLARAGVAAELEPGESFGAELLGFFGEGVDLFAGERPPLLAAAGDADGLDAAAGFDGGLEDAGVGALGPVGDVLELEAVADVGAVDAEAFHRLQVAHTLEDGGEFDVEDFLPEADEEAGDDVDDVVGVDEGHFDIKLSEFGLAVGAEILIAEAAGDLVCSVPGRRP